MTRLARLPVAAGIGAVVVALVIVFATLSPINLRPNAGRPYLEYLEGFGLLGLLLGLSLRRRMWMALVVIACLAVGLELAQLLTPDRHARLADLGIKLLGGGIGVAVAFVAIWTRWRWRHRD